MPFAIFYVLVLTAPPHGKIGFGRGPWRMLKTIPRWLCRVSRDVAPQRITEKERGKGQTRQFAVEYTVLHLKPKTAGAWMNPGSRNEPMDEVERAGQNGHSVDRNESQTVLRACAVLKAFRQLGEAVLSWRM